MPPPHLSLILNVIVVEKARGNFHFYFHEKLFRLLFKVSHSKLFLEDRSNNSLCRLCLWFEQFSIFLPSSRASGDTVLKDARTIGEKKVNCLIWKALLGFPRSGCRNQSGKRTSQSFRIGIEFFSTRTPAAATSGSCSFSSITQTEMDCLFLQPQTLLFFKFVSTAGSPLSVNHWREGWKKTTQTPKRRDTRGRKCAYA